jgi:uncharacterized protein (DUF608 family)
MLIDALFYTIINLRNTSAKPESHRSSIMTALNSNWPVLTSYAAEQLRCIGLPLGGIGTGTISLGGRGQLFDWEIHNHPAKGEAGAAMIRQNAYFGPSLFTLAVKPEGGKRVLRALEGALLPSYGGSHGVKSPFHGAPRFRECSFRAAYPFGQVCLSDPSVPVEVRLEAFNPLIPGDADASGIPMAVLRYVVRNPNDVPAEVSVCGSLANLVGGEEGHRNLFCQDDGLSGIMMMREGGDTLARDYGTMVLATTETEGISHKTCWRAENWRRPFLHFWDDLAEDGRLDDSSEGEDDAYGFGSLAASATLAPGEERAFTFLIAWHFPNRYSWAQDKEYVSGGDKKLDPSCRIGNYYAEQYADAWDVACRESARLPELERQTVDFVGALCNSDLPATVKEAALYNVSTLRSETCFRTPDGNLYGWEGCNDTSGSCPGNCTHVWNYETTVPFLFADLARTMREVEFLYATNEESGAMSFRTALPLEREKGEGTCAADGQMGCIMKAYRDWRLCGDDAWLRKLWPRVRKALEFCWVPGGWDADRDGVMEGCQHNTMDVEYYGPNAQMGTWYLGALRAAEEMARHLGETNFADTCRKLFENGSRWLDANLFNGEYYEQEIRPADSAEAIHPALMLSMGSKDVTNPDLQLGPACLIDQLVGQYMAHVCGLGYLLKPEHVRKTLDSIVRYNRLDQFYDHFNNMRTYVLNDESAMLMATYPHGGRPESPFPYFNEVMTGFEYCAATHMLYEGMTDEGLRAIADIRARYDGARRNPFDEAECGHHYARAMAAWSGILALTGFQFDACTGTMRFDCGEGTWFWSNGAAWGTCELRNSTGRATATLRVLHGTLSLTRFEWTDTGRTAWETSTELAGTVFLALQSL